MLRLSIVALALALVLTGGCVRSDPDPAPEASARFVPIGDGVVHEPRAGLAWTRRQRPPSLHWGEAEAYCRGLRLDGHADWRLPEVEELASLYDPAHAEPCGERTCHLDPLITVATPYLWSGTARGASRRFYVDLLFGVRLSPVVRPGLVRGVLCVRPHPS